MCSIQETQKPAPTIQLSEVAPGVSLLKPLSRQGHGPGLIVLSSTGGVALVDGAPSVLMKWAEEGFTVVEITASAFDGDKTDHLEMALKALSDCESCTPKEKVGIVCYNPNLWLKVAPQISSNPTITCAVVFADATTSTSITEVTIPILQHIAGAGKSRTESSKKLKIYHYSEVESSLFATPLQPKFNYSSEAVSHTRSLTFLKPLIGGPYFDLEAIWEEHTYFEFEVRSVPQTMATMVEEPYVNHIPTITGGIGRVRLSDFYANHFVHQNPKDTELELISRTVGIDRVIDEFIYKFTHDMQIDWLLPGIPPTGRYIQLSFTAVVNIRGDRLYHEHIAWDQATALVQLGLLPEYLPYPYALPDGRTAAPGKRFEYKVPATGSDTAEKMRNKNSVVSNHMFAHAIREVDE